MESPHAGPGGFRVRRALSLFKGTFRNALSTTRKPALSRACTALLAGASHIRASASRAHRTFRQGDLECLMGGRAGSHGGPCARWLPVSWRAAGSCSSSAARRGAVLRRRPRRQPRLAAWSRGRPQARRARRSLRLRRPRRRLRQHHPRRLRQRPRRRRRRPRQRPRLREQHRPRQPGRRLRHRPRRLLLRRRLSCYPLSNEGTCYEPGEFCRNADHGKTGVAGDGKAIKCEDNDGWRWEPV